MTLNLTVAPCYREFFERLVESVKDLLVKDLRVVDYLTRKCKLCYSNMKLF